MHVYARNQEARKQNSDSGKTRSVFGEPGIGTDILCNAWKIVRSGMMLRSIQDEKSAIKMGARDFPRHSYKRRHKLEGNRGN